MDLEQENEQLKKELAELRQLLEKVLQENKELKARLSQDSQNSSWPPSRDITRKKRKKTMSLRQKSERKAGGQKGHQGHTLEIQTDPEIIKTHRPSQCTHCQANLSEDRPALQIKKRQVIDLPPLKFITTEHQAEAVCCDACGKITSGQFPEGVTQPVQYGPGVKQLSVYLRSEQFIPYQRCQQMLNDCFGLSISTGSLQNFFRLAHERVKPITEQIEAAVTQSKLAFADETGFYIGGHRHWLHTASTQHLSAFNLHRNRGRKAVDDIGILPHFRGVLVHDAWPTYFMYDQIHHALCNVHHLRDLNGLIENSDQEWPAQMKAFLLDAKAEVDQARVRGQSHFDTRQLDALLTRYAAIMTLAFEENPLPPPDDGIPKPGRPKKGRSRSLVERFETRQDAILRFIHDFKVPFDNNLAERDIRMLKVQQKISGCFRSWDGAEQFCALRSYTSSLRKQGLNVWNALASLFDGEVISPDLSPV